MADLIHVHSASVVAPDGAEYEARIMGEEREDGTWAGWIEFHPRASSARGTVRVTDRETSQPNRAAVEYWAGGLEPLYLDGALSRATPR